MSKWIAEFELEDGDTMPEHMDLNYMGARIDLHCRPLEQEQTGHWITKDGREQGYDIGGIKTWYVQIMCDKCGFIRTVIEGHTAQYKFCPNCGCRMKSEVEQ